MYKRQLDLAAERHPGLTGVWIRGRKIASIGIYVRQWVTFHGFALNVATDARAFDAIVPCGIHGVRMTSIADEAGATTDLTGLWNDTRQAVIAAMATVFDLVPVRTVDPTSAPALSPS